MSFKGLNLIEAPERPRSTPQQRRRQRLVEKISEQIRLAAAEAEGHPTRRGWWWRRDDGTFAVSVPYAKRHIELAKGKHAVVCDKFADVVPVLEMARTSAMNGDFDPQLNEISTEVRANFKRNAGS